MNVIALNNSPKKTEILARLQREILPLQGLRSAVNGTSLDVGLGIINASMPNNNFPLGAVHEFISTCPEDHAASSGFISAILGPLLKNGSAGLWISNERTLFPAALKNYGLAPERIVFVDVQKQRDIAWAMDEALKCGALSCVVGELPDLGFTASRRLQLSVEQSKVTAFVLRRNPKSPNTTACVTRWKISQLPSETIDDLPGVGFPCWNVELLKVRNGKPGSWKVKWMNGKMDVMENNTMKEQVYQTKIA